MAGNYDDEAVQRITANAIRVALQQDREEWDRQSQLATQAAVAAAVANQSMRYVNLIYLHLTKIISIFG